MNKMVSWVFLRDLSLSKGISIQFYEDIDSIFIYLIDGGLTFHVELDKNDSKNAADIIDFNTNYKLNSNKKIQSTDQDGAVYTMAKMAPEGWHFFNQSLEFSLSTFNSIYEKEPDGSDYNHSTLFLYKGDDINGYTLCIDQADADANCSKTILRWWPTNDYALVGGKLRANIEILNNCRLWIVAAPLIPKIYGGDVDFICGTNLKFLKAKEDFVVDSKTSKVFPYHNGSGENCFDYIFKHLPGEKVSFELQIFIYKQ